MLDGCREWVQGVFKILAAAPGCSLYNCTTGKDRTGLISALLLGICGADGDDIAADYMISEVYLADKYKPLLDAYNNMFPETEAKLSDPFFRTEPRNIYSVIDWINSQGGFEKYLLSCDIPIEDIAKIRTKLILSL